MDTLKRIDEYIANTGLSAPEETVPRRHDGYRREEVTELDLKVGDDAAYIAEHMAAASSKHAQPLEQRYEAQTA